VPIKDLDDDTAFLLQSLSVGYVYFKLSMTDQEIAEMIVNAEQLASEQGWDPPLAASPKGPEGNSGPLLGHRSYL
jgi:hypothetical protein